jgi:hypothetical protein
MANVASRSPKGQQVVAENLMYYILLGILIIGFIAAVIYIATRAGVSPS